MIVTTPGPGIPPCGQGATSSSPGFSKNLHGHALQTAQPSGTYKLQLALDMTKLRDCSCQDHILSRLRLNFPTLESLNAGVPNLPLFPNLLCLRLLLCTVGYFAILRGHIALFT